MNTAIQPQTRLAASPTLPAKRLNPGAAALSLVLTCAVLGAVVFGMDAMAGQHMPMSAAIHSVQAG